MWKLWNPVSRRARQRSWILELNPILGKTLRLPTMLRFQIQIIPSVSQAAVLRQTTGPTGRQFGDELCNLDFIKRTDVSPRCGPVIFSE